MSGRRTITVGPIAYYSHTRQTSSSYTANGPNLIVCALREMQSEVTKLSRKILVNKQDSQTTTGPSDSPRTFSKHKWGKHRRKYKPIKPYRINKPLWLHLYSLPCSPGIQRMRSANRIRNASWPDHCQLAAIATLTTS